MMDSGSSTSPAEEPLAALDVDDYIPLEPVDSTQASKIDIPLLPLADTTGTVRSDEAELLPQATQFKNGGFFVTVREAAVVHGHYKGKGTENVATEPASLLVYHWELNGGGAARVSDGREIHAIDLKLRFEASPLGEPKDDPWAAAYFPVPGNRGFTFQALAVDKFEKKAAGAGASAKGGAAGASVGVFGWFSKATGKTYSSVENATCKSTAFKTTSRGGGRGGEDVITWTLADNGSTSSLPDVFAVAVVIKRPPNAKSTAFKVVFDIDAVVDTRHDWWAKLRKLAENEAFPWNREAKHSKTYSIDGKEDLPKSLKDKDHLYNEVKGFGLRKFVFFHVPEEGKAKEFFTNNNRSTQKSGQKRGEEEQRKKEDKEGGGGGEAGGGGGGEEGGEPEGGDDKDVEDEDEDEDDDVFEDAQDFADQNLDDIVDEAMDDGPDDD